MPLRSEATSPPLSESTSPKKNASSIHYQLVMCITADGKSVSTVLKNTLSSFHSLQKKYSFKGVLFTTSPSLIRFANSMNVDVITSFRTNPYHLPLVNNLLLTISKRYSASYYGYMNSDILLNPQVFAGMNIVSQAVKEKKIHTPLEIASRVIEMPLVSLSAELVKSPNLAPILKKYQNDIHFRPLTCSDVFIFSADWPFEAIPPFVVGRRWIDYGFNAMAVKYNYPLIDASTWSNNIHQGFNSYRQKTNKKSHNDYFWNKKYYRALPKASLVHANWRLCPRTKSLKRKTPRHLKK